MPLFQLSNDLTIHYEDFHHTGSPTVLLLHGLGVTGESWGLQLPAFQEAGFRILTPDVSGFGKSTCRRGGVTIRQLAGDMVDLLRYLSVANTAIVGISMGGTLALQIALDNPDLVSRLVLINTFSCLRPRQIKTWCYFAARFILAHAIGVHRQAQAVAYHLFPDPKDEALRQIFISQISEADPSGYRAAMRALARFNVSARLNEVTIPTLVITGGNDTTVPLDVQGILANNIPGARHTTIPGAGHAVTVEQPDQVNRLLIDFITSSG
jgi:3-oxoadipate enol-lactonase